MPRFFISTSLVVHTPSSSRLSILWPYGLLLLVVAGLYGQSLGFGYVWDDRSLFAENTLLREGSWSWATVARPVLPDAPYFRPLVLATWMAEVALFELNPVYSHAINAVLHAANSCLVYAIAFSLWGQRKGGRLAAVTAALIFAVHPCLIEGVAWVSGRFDVLATALLLLGCVLAMAPATAVRCVCVGLLAFGAMLSKEIGVLFAPILLLLVIARNPGRPLLTAVMQVWPHMLAYAIAVVIYFNLRSQALGFASYSNFGVFQVWEAILNYDVWLRRLSFYTFMAFVPFSSISPLHEMQMELSSYRQQFLALAIAALLAMCVVFFAFKRRAWAVLWLGFYVAIFPVLGLFSINISGTIGAERFLYLPIAMLALGLASLCLAICERDKPKNVAKVAGGVLVGGWILLSVFVTYTVAGVWASGVQLWGWQYHLNPGSKLARLHYFNELSMSKDGGLHEIFKKEIEALQNKNNGRLPIEAQITYSNFLLINSDPEALPYLEGLVVNMGMRGGAGVQLHDTIYAGVLANYAQALMVFKGELDVARDAMEQAKVITPRGAEFQLIHQMIALEYLLGNKQVALNLYGKNFSIIQAVGIEKTKSSMRTIVKEACGSKGWGNCDQYASGFIRYLDAGESDVLKKNAR